MFDTIPGSLPAVQAARWLRRLAGGTIGVASTTGGWSSIWHAGLSRRSGRPIRKPWICEQPSSRTRSRSASVSTPSAVVGMPSAARHRDDRLDDGEAVGMPWAAQCDEAAVDLDLARSRCAADSRATNSRCRNRRAPSADAERAQRIERCGRSTVPSRRNTRFGHLELEPARAPGRSGASALTTLATRPSASNWTADRLTASLTCSGHFAASAQAVRSTQSPIGRIRPASSAIGMKTTARISPRLGCVPAQQRLEADDLAESSASTIGW